MPDPTTPTARRRAARDLAYDTLEAEGLPTPRVPDATGTGLAGRPWTFQVDARPKRRMGQCRYGKRHVAVSAWHVDTGDWAVVVDTVLHEVAHAVTGPGHGHDKVWRANARRLGADPSATHKDGDKGGSAGDVDHKWYGWCAGCQRGPYRRHQLVRRLRRAQCKCGGYFVWLHTPDGRVVTGHPNPSAAVQARLNREGTLPTLTARRYARQTTTRAAAATSAPAADAPKPTAATPTGDTRISIATMTVAQVAAALVDRLGAAEAEYTARWRAGRRKTHVQKYLDVAAHIRAHHEVG